MVLISRNRLTLLALRRGVGGLVMSGAIGKEGFLRPSLSIILVVMGILALLGFSATFLLPHGGPPPRRKKRKEAPEPV